MWTAARASAALEGRMAEAFTYEVAFGRALLLPSTAELRTRPVDVRSHLTGTIRRSVG
jgi:hypothetical protein